MNKCVRCNHEWEPRKNKHKRSYCPKCHNIRWDIQKKIPFTEEEKIIRAKESAARWQKNNHEKFNERRRRYYTKLKNLVFSAYSNGTLCCVNCGFQDMRALQLDHVNNDGYEERKRLVTPKGNFSSSTLYKTLKTKGFPSGYQVLCANCNVIKARIKLQEKVNSRKLF